MSGQPEVPYMDWRAFLQTEEIDVFQTIENAILIAATDFPDKFLEKKDHLMKTIISTAKSHESLLKFIVGSGTMKDEKKASEDNTKRVEGKRNIEEGEIVENSNEDDMKDEKKASDQDYSKSDDKGYIDKEEQEENFNDNMNFNTFVKKRKTDVASAKGGENAETSVYGIPREWNAVDATYSSLNNVVTTDKEVCAGTLVAKEVKMESEDFTLESDVAKSVLKIKNVLLAMKHQPAVIHELLLKLDRMESDISFEVLQATGIAGVVSSFKAKDYSIEIRQIVDMLIENWETVFDEWIAQDSNALRNAISKEVKIANVNEITLANINEVMVAEAKALKPKSLFGAGCSSVTRTAFIPSSQGPSKPPRAQPLYRTGSRDPASTDDVTIAASKHEPKSSRKARPSRTKRSVSLKYSEGPPNHQSSEPLVSIRSGGPANERPIVDGQPTKMYPPINREPTSASSVRTGDSSRGNNNTFLTSQPRHQLQGPMEKPDAENKKMKMPAPAEKIEEDSVKESLQIAKRKLQERLQKSQQAKRSNMGPQSAEKDTSIGELLSQYRRGPR